MRQGAQAKSMEVCVYGAASPPAALVVALRDALGLRVSVLPHHVGDPPAVALAAALGTWMRQSQAARHADARAALGSDCHAEACRGAERQAEASRPPLASRALFVHAAASVVPAARTFVSAAVGEWAMRSPECDALALDPQAAARAVDMLPPCARPLPLMLIVERAAAPRVLQRILAALGERGQDCIRMPCALTPGICIDSGSEA